MIAILWQYLVAEEYRFTFSCGCTGNIHPVPAHRFGHRSLAHICALEKS
ncbi:MAG: hypothetical protein KQH63_04580 [Desulfobulbaceae bacterium]|nr:hypothetical protein [Desulfobulbaceae bacterium]